MELLTRRQNARLRRRRKGPLLPKRTLLNLSSPASVARSHGPNAGTTTTARRTSLVILCVAAGLSFALLSGWSSASSSSTAGALPLTADQRQQREEYWFSRRGLQFGVQRGSYDSAVRQMRGMETAETHLGRLSAISSFTWKFIGPKPMLNEVANFGGITSNTWSPLSSATGRVTAIAFDPNTRGQLFVGTANGGVWIGTSSDGGTTFVFKSITDSLPTQAIGSIALDPTTVPTTIYVGTGEGNGSVDSYYGQGIFKSGDLGASWAQLGGPVFAQSAVASIALDTTQTPRHILAGVTFGFSANRADAFQDESPEFAGGTTYRRMVV